MANSRGYLPPRYPESGLASPRLAERRESPLRRYSPVQPAVRALWADLEEEEEREEVVERASSRRERRSPLLADHQAQGQPSPRREEPLYPFPVRRAEIEARLAAADVGRRLALQLEDRGRPQARAGIVVREYPVERPRSPPRRRSQEGQLPQREPTPPRYPRTIPLDNPEYERPPPRYHPRARPLSHDRPTYGRGGERDEYLDLRRPRGEEERPRVVRREEAYPEPIHRQRSEPTETIRRGLEALGRPQREAEPPRARHVERALGRRESEANAVLEMLGRGAVNSRAPEPLEGMPLRGSAKAPKFSGKAQDLVDYLHIIQFLCQGAGCRREREWVKWACWYLDRETATLWKAIADEEANDWNAFVTSLVAMYPGASRLERTFVKQDLRDLVEAQVRKDIETEEDLGEYYRKYTEIARYLVERRKITSDDFDSHFLEGLDPELTQEVLSNLKCRYGIRRRDDPWPLDCVMEELKFLLEDRFKTTRTKAAKRGVVRLSAGEEATRVAQELAQRQPQVRAEAAAQQAAVGNPEAGNQFVGRANPAGRICFFCFNAGHQVSFCQQRMTYLREGKCQVVNGQLCFLDGTPIRRTNGSLKEEIDRWLTEHGAAEGRAAGEAAAPRPEAGAQGAHIFMVEDQEPHLVSAQMATTARIEEVVSGDEGDEETLEYALAVNEKDKPQRRQKFDGVVISNAPPKAQGANPAPSTSKEAPSKGKERQGARPTNAPNDSRAGSGTSGFHYGSAADIPDIEKKIVNMALDVVVPVPFRDLVALKSVQRSFREYTAVKRVSGEGTAAGALAAVETEGDKEEEERVEPAVDDAQVASVECEGDEPEIQRLTTMPLTFVPVEVAGQVVLEGILDSGSQIVALRKEIAEVLRLPIEKDGSITMETANKGREATEGVISDCEIDFGGVTVCVPVQVVKNAAFDILLGRPFSCALRAKTEDFPNGDQKVEITDPRSGKRIVVTPRQQGRYVKAPHFHDPVAQAEYHRRMGHRLKSVKDVRKEMGF